MLCCKNHMNRSAEAFKEPYPDEDPGSGEGQGAVILPFRPKAIEGTESRQGHDYDEYKALGGTILSQAEYQSVRERAAQKGNIPSDSTRSQTDLMTEDAGITLSPETVTVYGILRGDRKPTPDTKGHYSEQGDQQLLAEALRITGDKISLTIFVENHRNIF